MAYEEKDGYVTFHCSPISKAYTYKLNWANQRTGEKFTESYEQAAPQFTILFQVADTCDFWISAVNTVTGKVELESNHVTYVGKAGSSSAAGVTRDKINTSKKPDLHTVSNHQMQNNNNVVVKRASLSSVKNKKKRSFTAKWKKVPDAKGYQIQYVLSKKKLSKGKRKNVKKTSVTIKKLKKKKTYYVRVRAYKVVGNKNVYGKWSTVKRVKIKK